VRKATSRRILAGAVLALALCLAIAPAKSAAGADMDWPMYGATYANDHYSPLDQINTGNVSRLRVAYTLSLGVLKDHQATPIVVGDTLYVPSSFGPKYVYAVDAKTGKIKWTYTPNVPADVIAYNCCGGNNRGVAYANGRVFVGRLDGYLVALDANTGKELWKTQVVDYKAGTVLTSPPLPVHDKVITGYNGAEFGGRGALQAYDQATGRLIWRTYTIPGPGEPGNDTWKGDSWKHGGAVVWNVGAYDPELNLTYWGTGNAAPWAVAPRAPDSVKYGKFTNLYAASVIAVNPDTGKMVWYFQETPADAWDYDATEPLLANLKINGKTVPALIDAGKNGFLFVADRRDGRLLSAKPYVYINWAKSFNIETGRPVEVAAMRPTFNHEVKNVCPHIYGGKSWEASSYNPKTGLLYINSNNMCQDIKEQKIDYHRGTFYLGTENTTLPGPGGYLGKLVAIDPATQKQVWGAPEPWPANGGVLSTGGGLVFYGDWEGYFNARDAATGALLWKFNTGNGISAAPITYQIDGKQYVAVVAGKLSAIPGYFGELGKRMIAAGTPEGGTLFVFALE
jgi:alcohol dehydrogenase (cytochrome c)